MDTAMTPSAGRHATAAQEDSVERRSVPLHAAGIALALATVVLGIAMIVLGFTTRIPTGPRISETAVGLVASAGGLLLLRFAWRGERVIKSAGPLGDLTALCSFLYLGTVLPLFGHHLVSRSTAQLQFVTVLAGLVVGTTCFALNPAPSRQVQGGKRLAQIFLAADGVVLVVGTILLSIGIGVIDKPMLIPPKWDWTSFLGLTVPGMVWLIVVRGAAKRLSPSERTLGWKATGALVVLAWEILLVIGLAVMLYGAFNNLTLGANGFKTGIKGNTGGLELWAAAAAFLIFIRGPVERTVIRLSPQRWYAVGRELLYVIGIIAFIYGERSVLIGKDPKLVVGDALPVAALILVAAVCLLVPIRLATKPAILGQPEPAGSQA